MLYVRIARPLRVVRLFILLFCLHLPATFAQDTPRAPGNNTSSDVTTLPEMTVAAPPVDKKAYTVPNTTTATKTDTPIMQTPASIQVIPKEVLDDQQAFTAQEALKNVAGIQPDGSYGGPFNQAFILRGFTTEWNTVGALAYREGVRLKAPVPIAGLERIELLKGPATVLYGQAVPGGIINYIPKDPLSHPYYSLQQQFGSYNLYRTSVDVTGPLNKSGSLRYRFNLEYADSDSFRDSIFADLIDIAPTLAWDITPDTQLEIELQYNQQDYRTDHGIPALGNRPAKLPRDIDLMEGLAHEDTGIRLVDIDLVHRLNDAWQLRFKGLYGQYDFDVDDTVYPTGLDESTGDLSRGSFEEDDDGEIGFVSLDVTGTFDLFRTKHTLLIGADYYDEDTDSIIAFPDNTPINIFNPVYGTATRTTFTPENTLSFPYRNQWWGVYIQDQVEVFDSLHLLLGMRYDDAEWLFAVEGTPPNDGSEVSPRFGLVYQPWSWLALYGSYSESFDARNGRSADGTPFDPETADQYEAGVKTELLDGRLSATLAFYELTKFNVLTDNPNTPEDPTDQLAIGEARSRGVEIDIQGQITERLSVIASYAYTDTKISEDESGRQGNRLPLVPFNAGSVWTKYDLTSQFSVGAGLFTVGRREVDEDNSAQLPGYVRLDAMAAYRWQLGGSRLTAQLNFSNLTDEKYFKTAFNRNSIIPGDPLLVFGSLRFEY